jgi:DNA-directed RNA polymerase subunit beta'
VVLSGLKYAEFEQVARGKKYLGGLTGGPAIEQLLRRVDPEKEIPTLKASLPKLKGQVLDQVNRKLKFLLALQEFGKKPHEVYLTRLVPVLPPIFRPLSPLPDGTLVPDDLNFHYNRLAHLTNELRTFDPSFLDPRKEFLRTQIYDGLRIYAGLTERGVRPLFANMGGKRKAKGILEILRGGEKQQAKEGFIQAKMVKKKQDLSMRATIVPQPNMHLDELGIPREAAFEIYKPFIVQKFTAKGYAPGPALAEVKKRTPIAERLLEQVMEERPVLAKRDPALHQYNFMAYKPKLVEGKAIHIHPLVVTALGGDFDGDQIAAFVPLTEEARREAFKLFPSNRLFSSTTYDVMHTPYHEAIYGLHLISKWGKPHAGRFENLKAAAEAEQTGKIQVTDVIHLGGKKTTLGRELLTAALPELLRKKPLETLGGKTLGQLFSTPEFELVEKVQAPHQVSFATLFTEIARRHPKDYPTSVGQLSQLGSHYAYELGASIGLKDLVVNKKLRAEILHKYDDEAHRLQVAKLPPAERDEKLVALYSRATTEMQEKMGKDLLARGNAYYDWYRTGARGSQSQVMQIAAAPMLMQDAKGRTVPRPVTRSYAEGLDLGDYWTAAHGARTGTLQKSISSQEPGAATKSLINATISTLIESKDCGSTEGISMGVRERDSVDRFLAAPVKVGRKTLPAGTLLSPQALSELLKHKVDQVVVRSPLRCKHGQGICATCFGLSPQGTLYEPGTNIGTLAAQAIGEPMLNVAMKSWHGGGTAAGSGARTAGRFQRMRQLLEMPGHIPNAAVLAEKAGTIDRIAEDTVLNGHHVFVEGHQHFVPAGQALSPNGKPLQVGQKVRKGDALSVGTVNPHDLLELSDIHRVQRYLVDTLHQDILEGKVRKSNLETVIRATTNLTRVLDPGDSPYLRGDVVQRSHVEAHNRDLKPGEKPVGHKPILRHLPVTVLAQHEDWLARLNYRRQKETLLEGVARGWKSSIHGPNPLPSYMLGTQFGLGTKEHPHYY